MRLTGLPSAVLIGALASVVGAEAYRFIFDDSEAADTDIVSSEGAARWRESRFPLTFRMLDNDYLPSEIGIDEGRWAAIVERSLERWTDIPTSSVQLVLDDRVVKARRTNAGDGINTVGFTSDWSARDLWPTAFSNWRFHAGRLTQCDIRVNPHAVRAWRPREAELHRPGRGRRNATKWPPRRPGTPGSSPGGAPRNAGQFSRWGPSDRHRGRRPRNSRPIHSHCTDPAGDGERNRIRCRCGPTFR